MLAIHEFYFPQNQNFDKSAKFIAHEIFALYGIINPIKGCLYSATIAYATVVPELAPQLEILQCMQIFKTYTNMHKYHPVADKCRFYLECSVFMHMYV